MKKNGLKVSLLFGIIVQFLFVHGLPLTAHDSICVEHGGNISLSPYVLSYGWINEPNLNVKGSEEK